MPTEEVSDCQRCGDEVPPDELDEEGFCRDCLSTDEDMRQAKADYRSWVL